MATLEKIRTRAGVFITVIIGIALLSFLVNPQDIVHYFQSSKNVVGKIDGKKIDYQHFAKMVDQYTPVISMQFAMMQRQASQEEIAQAARDQVWNSLLLEHYLNGQFEKVGIGVSEKELGNLATVNLSPVMALFPMFVDPYTKQVNRENVQLFWQNPNRDRDAQNFINFLEDEIRNYALITKYTALISQAGYANSLEVKRTIHNHANSAEFDYIVQRYMGGAEADSLYRIKESEAKSYYNKYIRRYEQVESRDIEMVVFPISPTQEDYDLIKAKAENLAPQFAASTDLPQFVQSNSDMRADNAEHKFDYTFYKKGELPSELEEFAFSASRQDVLGPYLDGSSYKIARIQDERMVPDSIFFKKMVLQVTSQEELNHADSIVNLLRKGGNWAEIARTYSADPQDAANGGEIGWIAHNQLPYPLLDSLILNPTGKIFSLPVQGGMYVFQAAQKSKESKMVRMAVVQKDVVPSKKTDAAVYDKAVQLASSSHSGYDAFRKAVQEGGYTAQPAPNIVRGSKEVLSISNAQPIVEWLYKDETEKNSISHPINVNQQYYVVAAVTEVREDGPSPFDQVKLAIGEELKKEKQAEAFAARMREAAASSNSLEELAAKLNLAVLQVTSPVTFGSAFTPYNSYIPGIGVEPRVTAAATTITELNGISEPIAGNAGVYVISITNRRTDEGFTKDMAIQTLNRESMMKLENWFGILLKAANVKDFRARFFH